MKPAHIFAVTLLAVCCNAASLNVTHPPSPAPTWPCFIPSTDPCKICTCTLPYIFKKGATTTCKVGMCSVFGPPTSLNPAYQFCRYIEKASCVAREEGGGEESVEREEAV